MFNFITGSENNIKKIINSFYTEKSTTIPATANWKTANPDALDREARINDILRQTFYSKKPPKNSRLTLLSRSISNRYAQFQKKWNDGCSLLGINKFKISSPQERPLTTEERIQVIATDRLNLEPFWDILGWVTEARVKKAEKVLNQFLVDQKINNLPQVFLDTKELSKESVEKIFQTLRGKPVGRHYTDDELYLIVHLVSRHNKELTIPNTDQTDSKKKWDSWRQEALTELFNQEGISTSMFDEIKQLQSNPNKTRLGFDFNESRQGHIPFLITLSPWGNHKRKEFASALYKHQRLVAPTMRLESHKLWNCLPKQDRDFFHKISNSQLYKKYIDQYLTKEINDRIKEKLDLLKQDNHLLLAPNVFEDFCKQTIQNMLAEHFGAPQCEVRLQRNTKGYESSHFEIYFKAEEEMSFAVSIHRPSLRNPLNQAKVTISRKQTSSSRIHTFLHNLKQSIPNVSLPQLPGTQQFLTKQFFSNTFPQEVDRDYFEKIHAAALVIYEQSQKLSSQDFVRSILEKCDQTTLPDILTAMNTLLPLMRIKQDSFSTSLGNNCENAIEVLENLNSQYSHFLSLREKFISSKASMEAKISDLSTRFPLEDLTQNNYRGALQLFYEQSPYIQMHIEKCQRLKKALNKERLRLNLASEQPNFGNIQETMNRYKASFSRYISEDENLTQSFRDLKRNDPVYFSQQLEPFLFLLKTQNPVLYAELKNLETEEAVSPNAVRGQNV